MPRSRSEHLQWCKDRALEYLNKGDIPQAVNSMISDLKKHEETATYHPTLYQLGMMHILTRNEAGVRSWIEGFR